MMPSSPRLNRNRRADVNHEDSHAVRTLGPVATALQIRRQRALATRPAGHTKPSSTGCLSLLSEDGAIAFVLRTTTLGLLVERTQRRPLHAHLVQSMLFDSLESFRGWCDADAVDSGRPVLYRRLKRHGDDVLGSKS